MPLSQLVQAARLRGAHAAGVRRRRRALPSTLLLLHELSSPLGGTLGFLLVLHRTFGGLSMQHTFTRASIPTHLHRTLTHSHTARTHTSGDAFAGEALAEDAAYDAAKAGFGDAATCGVECGAPSPSLSSTLESSSSSTFGASCFFCGGALISSLDGCSVAPLPANFLRFTARAQTIHTHTHTHTHRCIVLGVSGSIQK